MIKQHRNRVAASGEASPDGQKMSLVPCAALPFLSLSLSGGRRVGHSMMEITGWWRQPRRDVEVCGKRKGWAGLGQSRDAGCAGARDSSDCPVPRLW